MTCKLCCQDTKLYGLTVIPAGFFAEVVGQKSEPKLFFCDLCIKKISALDNYAVSFFMSLNSNSDNLKHSLDEGEAMIDKFDYQQLKLFFISLLWRASISTEPFYDKVKLEYEQEEKLKNLIQRNSTGSLFEYASFISKLSQSPANIPKPELMKWFDIKHYTFQLGCFIVYIKVDKRKSPTKKHKLIAKPDEPLFIELLPLAV